MDEAPQVEHVLTSSLNEDYSVFIIIRETTR